MSAKFVPPGTEPLNLVMAAYAIYLATGNTIYSQSIRASTISVYLRDAATLISHLDPIEDRDARKMDNGITYIGIQKILAEVQRTEKIPNRREPYTLAMHRALFDKVKFLHIDSKTRALLDWNTVGLQGGFRRSEYCQTTSSGALHQYETCDLGGPKAFAVNDVEFFSQQKVQLCREYALKHPDAVRFVKLQFRWQKNGRHGIHRWFARNLDKPFLCGVSAWISIVDRFIRLLGMNCADKPLAIYQHAKSRAPRYITSTIATQEMRSLATAVHNITKKEDLQKFSCHSLRVGACCIYFASGVDPEFIKRVLRWESDAWKLYVRDLQTTAVQVVESMNYSDDLPVM